MPTTTSGSCSRRITTRRKRAPKRDTLFRLGYLELEQLATLETLYWGACREILPG